MTKAKYARYESEVAKFIATHEISNLSTSTEDFGESMDNYPDGDGNCDPWFSWSPCECCKSHLGGDREYLYARDSSDAIVRFTICVDCVYYVNYGRLDDMTMMEMEA